MPRIREEQRAAHKQDVQGWELKNIYHHHPDSKKRKSSEESSGFIHPYGRYGNAAKTRKTISTIAILWLVKAIFENRATTVEVDSFVSPVQGWMCQCSVCVCALRIDRQMDRWADR